MAKRVISPMPVIAAEMRQTPLLRPECMGACPSHRKTWEEQMGIIGLLVLIILVILLLRLI